MEKYAKLMKGLEVCAGPDCCKDGCPYYGKTTGGMTCRARLLLDAKIAINNEQALRESAEEEMARLHVDVDDLEAANNTIRAERDGMRIELAELKEYALALEKEGQEARAKCDKLNQELTCIIQQREQAEADLHVVREQNKNLREQMEVLRDTNRSLDRELCRLQHDMLKGETDRPSVCDKELVAEVGKLIAQAKYQEGRADTLAAIVERCSFGGGCCHE